MNKQEKKELIKKLVEAGDKRSYHQIAADLELELWTIKHKGEQWVKARLKR